MTTILGDRLTAEEAGCEQHVIDSNHRAEDGWYTINLPMKQTKDQPLAIDPLQLCTKHYVSCAHKDTFFK
jgi:hypothetical protein